MGKKIDEISALVIRKEPLDWILSKKKTYEIRSKNCNKRGEIWLIEKGTCKVVGRARIVDSIKLSVAEYNQTRSKMGPRGCVPKIRSPKDINYTQIYAWVLTDVSRFRKPISYKHPKGAQSWVRLKRS